MAKQASKPSEDKSEVSIKSKDRVRGQGEVFTPSWLVNDMLDLVEITIDNKVLEPTCGNGNFLVAVLGRKLKLVRKSKDKSKHDTLSLLALSSIYGIDIMKDNVHECRERLIEVLRVCSPAWFTNRKKMFSSAEEILKTNIMWADTLKMKFLLNNKNLSITEWALNDKIFSREEYSFKEMIEQGKKESKASEPIEPGTFGFEVMTPVPPLMPIKVFTPIHFSKLNEQHD